MKQDISIYCPEITEVVDAINALKNNKDHGFDCIASEMLKAEHQVTA